ncbi:hypothetical protein NM208_g4856 [Fusarium decemcellulare]|uniref:Uncharacterized protein n=1 Tax=Fusarium decemcellulare TaxID=57161 RepID=A0ACC1SJ93_9HYPO|nr:hypothetical protein NM208_g4856 [Fusarium decemcellulare]
MPELNKLCTECQQFVHSFERDHQTIVGTNFDSSTWGFMDAVSESLHNPIHHSNTLKIADSAAQGCHLCSILREHIRAIALEKQALPVYIKPNTSSNTSHLKASISPYRIEVSLPMNSVPLVENTFDENGSAIPMAHYNDDGSKPDAMLGMMRDWLNQCYMYHPKCRQVAASHLPTRVIDVGNEEAGDKVSLVHTNQACGTYLTLSHCWGQSVSPRTTTTNLELHCRGITLDSLPRAFQDATWVTRCLGIQYLWIYSLCVIQDDKNDRDRESTAMADIYRGSLCNLATDGAYDGDIGLFLERNQLQVTTCKIPTSIPESWSKAWYIYPLGELYATLEENALSGPVSSSSWALRERLPCRTIHFLPNQIVWECREMVITEHQYMGEKRPIPELTRQHG